VATDDDGPQPFILTNAEKQSGLWMRLENHFKDRLATLRKQNDGDLTEILTAKLRGQIAAFEALLLLGKDMPPIEED
jgi:hypothetical protein